MSESGDIVRALEPLVDAFESLNVTYRVGGSVATSVYGTPRATLDVDVVCNLSRGNVAPLVAALEAGYYIDADMIDEAIRYRSSFNIIHLETMIKVDVFILKMRPFDQSAFSRSVEDTLEDVDDARRFHFSSPEDMLLHKLEWYRLGNEISERQWLDVLGVLKVQETTLDQAYLSKWAQTLGLLELLQRALDEADLTP